MKVKLIDEVFVNGRGTCVGSRHDPFEIDVEPKEARRLIAEGYALPAEERKRTRRKKQTRQKIDTAWIRGDGDL